MDGFLKFCVALSLLVASASVGYYYAVYLPDRDAKADQERKIERAKADYARQVEQSRIAEEKDAASRRAASEAEQRQTSYRVCVINVESGYSINWAAACKDAAEKRLRDLRDCQKGPALAVGNCERIYPILDGGPNCSLTSGRAASINDQLEKGRNRCMAESREGLQ